MSQRTWVILGATSIIAEHFAHLAAAQGHRLRLIGRDAAELAIRAQDIGLRYKVPCDVGLFTAGLTNFWDDDDEEVDVFIAFSDFTDNAGLTSVSIRQLIEVNVLTTVLIVHAYLEKPQTRHNLVYLSSVAACRGRGKNSLYAASKAAMEVYLEGLQQQASDTLRITVAKLGYIDTQQTYGLPGIFYAASPRACAKACWNAINTGKRTVYYPHFWRVIASLVKCLPFFMFRKIR